jgi:2-polyprenyl-6-methoxyphenol hydroxylase-like FAD-dependent oxidoreductase
MTGSPHVIVIGGGIGGLCLAQGLRGAGVSVAVYERDLAPASRWEGYRLHINPAGARSLAACLPERLWQAFLASAGPGGDFGFLTEKLTELLVVEESVMYATAGDPRERHYAADRATLRRLLRTGLDDVLRFGAEFVRYEHAPCGRVEAIFADGSRATGDLLVGADGAASRVRGQYLPHARGVDVGAVGIAHRTWLTDESRKWLPERLRTGMNLIMADQPCFLFTSVFQPASGAAAALADAEVTTPPAAPEPAGRDRPYVLGALVADPSHLPADLLSMDGDALRDVVEAALSGWHPVLRRLLAESDPGSRAVVSFHASEPVDPWPATNVTLLGDAAHTMPAVGGLGGNTALRDARSLSLALAEVARGERELHAAVAVFEERMREYGYAAVRDALTQKDRSLSTGVLRTGAQRAFMRLCSAVGPLRRRAFAGQWNDLSRPLPWEPEAAAHRRS